MKAGKTVSTPTKVKPTEQQLNKKFQELYNRSSHKKQKLQKLQEQRQREKQEKELKECTFQPKVNQQAIFQGSNLSPFIKREYDWLNKKQKKIQQMATLSETKVVQGCSFHPTISSKSIQILQTPTESSKDRLKNKMKQLKNQKKTYRQMHKMKEMQKNNSSLLLMTQKRNDERQMNLKQKSTVQMQSIQTVSASNPKKQISYRSQVRLSSQISPKKQKYAQNIPVKTEEQDTFNSVSSMDLKTQRKQTNGDEKSRIMIFEDEFEDQHEKAKQLDKHEDNDQFDNKQIEDKQQLPQEENENEKEENDNEKQNEQQNEIEEDRQNSTQIYQEKVEQKAQQSEEEECI